MNCHLSVLYSLLERYDNEGLQVHFASFEKMEKRIEEINMLLKDKGKSGVIFHLLDGVSPNELPTFIARMSNHYYLPDLNPKRYHDTMVPSSVYLFIVLFPSVRRIDIDISK